MGISIISAILFDLPLQEISKIITSHTDTGTKIQSSEESPPTEESKDIVSEDVVDESNVDRDIDEIWNNDSHNTKVTFADKDDQEEDVYSKRSFTPVWKKADDEKPVWGDDDEEECDDNETE